MNTNELLQQLDLDSTTTPPTDSGVVVSGPGRTAESVSPTALDIDAWGLRRGQELIAESERVRQTGVDGDAAADFFVAAFDPDPRLQEVCADRLRHAFLAQLLDTPDYQALHTETRLDDTASTLAAAHFAEQFARLQIDQTQANATDQDSSRDGATHDSDLAQEMAALRAVGRAVTEATKEVNELHAVTAALGLGPGSPGSNDPHTIAALFRRVRGDRTLQRICDLAGRFRRVAQSKQRHKVFHGLDDIVGVELGGDVGRLLPVELAKLLIPDLERDALRRIADHQALCREHHAVEPVGKGPILCVIDESGSMAGDRVHTAKAVVLALAWIARQQRRGCALIAYSGNTGERVLALPPGRWNEVALCDWLTAFLGHGSDLDVPVRELPRMYADVKAPRGRTDIVLITDARCRIDDHLCAHFRTWATAVQARVLGLIIDSSPGDLTAICDEVHSVPALEPTSEAVGRVLSL